MITIKEKAGKFDHINSKHFFFKLYLFILFLAALGLCCCVWIFLYLRQVWATLCCGAWASHCGGFSCCGAWALGVRASVAPLHVGSSQTRAQTCVPCIGRRILNHCATREAQ